MNFLDSVVPVKLTEVAQLCQKLKTNPFSALVENSSSPILLAEVKPKSPSEGVLFEGNFVELVAQYEQGGADALSVLTDQTFFGGSVELFKTIKSNTNLPLLRKEFVVDEVQLVESFAMGADAVLIIVQLVSPEKLKKLIAVSDLLGIVPLVEVVTYQDLSIALAAGATYIGVNARDLKTMIIDQEKALELLARIPASIHAFLFSGISSAADIREAMKVDTLRGCLVGTSLLRSENPVQKVKELKQALSQEKNVD